MSKPKLKHGDYVEIVDPRLRRYRRNVRGLPCRGGGSPLESGVGMKARVVRDLGANCYAIQHHPDNEALYPSQFHRNWLRKLTALEALACEKELP